MGFPGRATVPGSNRRRPSCDHSRRVADASDVIERMFETRCPDGTTTVAIPALPGDAECPRAASGSTSPTPRDIGRYPESNWSPVGSISLVCGGRCAATGGVDEHSVPHRTEAFVVSQEISLSWSLGPGLYRAWAERSDPAGRLLRRGWNLSREVTGGFILVGARRATGAIGRPLLSWAWSASLRAGRLGANDCPRKVVAADRFVEIGVGAGVESELLGHGTGLKGADHYHQLWVSAPQ